MNDQLPPTNDDIRARVAEAIYAKWHEVVGVNPNHAPISENRTIAFALADAAIEAINSVNRV